MSNAPDKFQRTGRQVAIVIAATGVLWLIANQFGAQMGLPVRYAFLIDLMALAAFVWCLIVTYGLWRQRRDN